MTVKELRAIISNLSDETILLLEPGAFNDADIANVETIIVELHPDGRSHLIFTTYD